MVKRSDTDYSIPVPEDWGDSFRYFLHDRYKPFNTAIIMFGIVAGFRIIFSPSNTELNTIQELPVPFMEVTIKVTLQFAMFLMLLFSLPCIMHFNVLVTKLLDKVDKK